VQPDLGLAAQNAIAPQNASSWGDGVPEAAPSADPAQVRC